MSWLFPAYFIGLLGLALPWILHRFSDQNPPEQLFPSKRFLEATTPPVSRKRTLRYRALLALRVLSVLLLCTLFAQPWINRDSTATDDQLHHIVAVDQSLSMQAEGRWQNALDEAGRILDNIGESSVQLVAFDERVSVVASSQTDNMAQVISPSSALDDLQPGFATADYGVLMQALDRLANEQELPVKLWLVSDMQKSALPAQRNALFAPGIAQFELVPVDGDDPLNVHLFAEALSDDGATASVSVSLMASLSGDSHSADTIERTIRIESGDELIEQQTVSLPNAELTTLNFDDLVLPAQANPEFAVSLLEPDAIDIDNRQRLPVVAKLPTGVVHLVSPESSRGSASVFITTALETDGLSRVETIRGTALQVPPDTSHLVTGSAVDFALELDVLQYVDKGNNALVYNIAEVSPDTEETLDGVGIGYIDEAHPLALGEIDWFGTRFYALPELALEDDDKVLIASSNGKSILVERPDSRGRLLILNDPMDGLASNLPLQPAFVALMQSLIGYFDASTSVPESIVVGERLALPANVQLIDPEGESVLGLTDSSRMATVALSEPGIYTVISARGEQILRAVLDANEADLSAIDDEDISAWQARYLPNEGDVDETEETGSTPQKLELQASRIASDQMRYSLWFWLLCLLVLFFLSEGWFANRRLNVRRDGS